MPNNFKLQGDYYVSKAGNDANDGLTPETPLLTIQAALNKIVTTVTRTIVIGSGVYKETLSKSMSPGATITLVNDGKVILEAATPTDSHFFFVNNSFGTYVFNGIEFRNCASIRLSLNNSNMPSYFNYCTFKNTLIVSETANNAAYFTSCLFINSSVSVYKSPDTNSAGVSVAQFNKNCFINSSVYSLFALLGTYSFGTPGNAYTTGGARYFSNNYVDSNSFIQFLGNCYSGTPGNFPFAGPYGSQTDGFNNSYNILASYTVNNNIQGKVMFGWSGAISGTGSMWIPITYAQARVDYPTFNLNSTSTDPKFNNPRLLDFTLQAGSPNVTASSDYVSNIGGTEYAVSYTASSAAFTTNATSQSLEYRGIYYGISGSATTGSITSGPMFLQWPRTKPLTSVNWIGALEFNKTITASLAGNNNVPAYTTFTSASGAQGANPDRLKIRLRYSTQQTQPATDAEWDNGGYWTAGTYQLFEPNTKPKVDYKGTGNGDPTYVETAAIGDLVPSWIQTEIILRNDYNR